MSFNWGDYVSLAEDLLMRTEESALRSAISRAYYGAFGIARNRKLQRITGNVHAQVINAYRRSGDANERAIGMILDILRRSRNEADYDADEVISKALAERAVIRAKEILARLKILVCIVA